MESKNKLVELTNNIFKDKLQPHVLPTYLKMAEFITIPENIQNGSLVWKSKECYDEYITQKGVLQLGDPVLANWDDFLNNSQINDYLTSMVIRSKKSLVREVINNFTAQGEIKQGDLKALEHLVKLFERNDNEEVREHYVQYVSPIGYDETFDNEEIMNLFTSKE